MARYDAAKISQLVGVDPYVAGYDETDAFSNLYTRQESMDALYAWAHHRAQPHAARWSIARLASQSASRLVEDGAYDVVYIDGCHQPAHVAADADAWSGKLRAGGVVIFAEAARLPAVGTEAARLAARWGVGVKTDAALFGDHALVPLPAHLAAKAAAAKADALAHLSATVAAKRNKHKKAARQKPAAQNAAEPEDAA